MSEEEILEEIKVTIYDFDGKRARYIDIDNVCGDECEKFIEAIEGLLFLYKKEKEKNKELLKTIPIDNYDDRYLKSIYMGGYYDGLRAKIKENWDNAQEVEIKSQVIPKYKIKKLIDQLEKDNTDYLLQDMLTDSRITTRCIEMLQELLEVENE